MLFMTKIRVSIGLTVSVIAILLFISSICAAESRQMSPDEYKNMVNSLGNQNKDILNKQAAQQYNSQKNVQKPVPAVTTEKPDTTDVNNTPVVQTPAPAIPVTTPTSPAQSGTVHTQQPFTGFGNPNNKDQNNNSPGDKSTGWKIQY